jgi:hypothetical protein
MVKRKLIVLSIFGIFLIGFILALFAPPHGLNNPNPLKKQHIQATEAKLQRLSHLLVYFYEKRQFPKNLNDLLENEEFQKYRDENKQRGITLKHIMADSWGEDFVYHRVNGNEVLLISKGPDQKLNTSDDIQLDVSLKQ